MKTGRPKGSRARAPKPRTITARVLKAYDAVNDQGQCVHRGTGDIARAVKASHAVVIRALNRWRPDWRTRFWPAEALAAREEE